MKKLEYVIRKGDVNLMEQELLILYGVRHNKRHKGSVNMDLATELIYKHFVDSYGLNSESTTEFIYNYKAFVRNMQTDERQFLRSLDKNLPALLKAQSI